MTNQHGLSRTIPETVKRAVRQRDGFGCVLCGSAVIEYDHFDPEYTDAREHFAAGIALLCPNCHANRGRGFGSVDAVRRAVADPFCRRAGFARGDMEGALQSPIIVFAGQTIFNCAIPVMVRGHPLIQVLPPEEDRGPYRVSASFRDEAGRPTLEIHENEWRVFSDQWDVEVKAGTISVRSEDQSQSLKLRFFPGQGLRVEALEMMCCGYRFRGDANTLQVALPGQPDFMGGGLTNNSMSNFRVGMAFG